MNHSRYYPYERNRYFYGKLLTVRDFEAEQKYVNDKRRLMNRLLHGTGVVSGLQVVAIDDKSVSVEMGVALDSLGREIVVPSPVTLKLSMIDGFTNNEYAKNVYLCIAYDEKGKEPVHSVAGSSVRTEEVSEYNRVLESYRLFVKEEAPNPAIFEVSQLLENVSILYQDAQVRVWQKTPKYVNPEDEFEIRLIVEKSLQTAKITFEYELETELFDPGSGLAASKISFVEPAESQESEYEVSFRLRSKPGIPANAKIGVRAGSAKLTIGDKRIDVDVRTAGDVEVIYGSVPERMIEEYYNRTLDQSLSSAADACIHLAKISLLQMGPTYVIDRVDVVPFGEYVYNTSMLYRLGMMNRQNGSSTHFSTRSTTYELLPTSKPQLSVQYNTEKGELDFRLGLPKQDLVADEIASGVAEIALSAKLGMNIFTRSEKRYFSDEIEHGLGKGPAFIVVGLEQTHKPNGKDFDQQNDAIFMGDARVFEDSPYQGDLSGIQVGTAVYPGKGTFRIGIKVPDNIEASKVKLRWWAYRKQLPTGIDAIPELEAAAGAETAGNEPAGGGPAGGQ